MALVLLGGAILTLSGCDDSPRSQRIYHTIHGTHGTLLAAAMRDEAVRVHAVSSIAGAPGEIATLYAGWLAEEDRFLRFEAGSDEIPQPGPTPWVLILHNTPAGYTGISACQGTPYEPEENARESVFRAIICDESGRLIEILGLIPADDKDIAGVYREMLQSTAGRLITQEDMSDR